MEDNAPDILIIGAGLAGLAAAEELVKAGRTVELLEARGRIGGRVFTEQVEGKALDLGAEWFDARGALRERLEAVGHGMEKARGDFLRRSADGLKSDDQEGDFAPLLKALGKLEGPDTSLLEALGALDPRHREPFAERALLEYVKGFHTADPHQLSLHWLLEVEKEQSAEASQWRSNEGAGAAAQLLSAHLGTRGRIHLDRVVGSIVWQPGLVLVHAWKEGRSVTHQAPKAIVTLPLAVLKAQGEGAVRFDPPLHTKVAAMVQLATGNVVKVVLVFREAFWQKEQMLRKALFVMDPRRPIPTWWSARPSDAPLWNGWAGGPYADPLLDLQGEDLRSTAVRSLAGALGCPEEEVVAHLVGCHSHDWSQDPFSRGAYTYVRPGGLHAHATLASPLERTLYFAGEATCGGGYNATMEGALRSGQRAARELLLDDGRSPTISLTSAEE